MSHPANKNPRWTLTLKLYFWDSYDYKSLLEDDINEKKECMTCCLLNLCAVSLFVVFVIVTLTCGEVQELLSISRIPLTL